MQFYYILTYSTEKYENNLDKEIRTYSFRINEAQLIPYSSIKNDFNSKISNKIILKIPSIILFCNLLKKNTHTKIIVKYTCPNKQNAHCLKLYSFYVLK